MAEEEEVEKYKRLYEEQKAKVKELERQNSQLKVWCVCAKTPLFCFSRDFPEGTRYILVSFVSAAAVERNVSAVSTRSGRSRVCVCPFLSPPKRISQVSTYHM